MILDLCSKCLLLAQNEIEKSMTKIGLGFFAVFLLVLIIDANIKNHYVPKNKSVQYFIVFMFIATIVALILLCIYYK